LYFSVSRSVAVKIVLIIKLVYVSCTGTPLGADKQTHSIPYYVTPYLKAAWPTVEYFRNFYMHVQVLNLFNAKGM